GARIQQSICFEGRTVRTGRPGECRVNFLVYYFCRQRWVTPLVVDGLETLDCPLSSQAGVSEPASFSKEKVVTPAFRDFLLSCLLPDANLCFLFSVFLSGLLDPRDKPIRILRYGCVIDHLIV